MDENYAGPGEEDGPWAEGWEKRSGSLSPLNDGVKPPYYRGECDQCGKQGLLRETEFSKNYQFLDSKKLCIECRTTTWHIRPWERMHPVMPWVA